MARNEIDIEAGASEVFDVLAEPESYAYWVVGSREIRDADERWPMPGTKFHHTVAFGPLDVKDWTSVEELEWGRRLRLRAKARPLGTAHVTIELEPNGDGGTRVTLTEDGADPVSALAFWPLNHVLTRLRNAESLRRLKRFVERRAAA